MTISCCRRWWTSSAKTATTATTAATVAAAHTFIFRFLVTHSIYDYFYSYLILILKLFSINYLALDLMMMLIIENSSSQNLHQSITSFICTISTAPYD